MRVAKTKGADQLRGYCEADLRLCFRLCRLLVFSRGGSISLQCYLVFYSSVLCTNHVMATVPTHHQGTSVTNVRTGGSAPTRMLMRMEFTRGTLSTGIPCYLTTQTSFVMTSMNVR